MNADSIFNIARYLKLHGFPQSSSLLFRLTALLNQNNRTPANQWLVLNQKFPGMGYIKVLKILHQIIKPKTYLEIGVFRGESFGLVGPQTHAIGIDPAPKFKLGTENNKELYAVTSDDFFSTAKKALELKGKVDFVFIDGLHTFEQALKDFINVEKLTHKNSVLVFHDILPFDAKAAQKNRETMIWMGDVWKIFPCLSAYRSDLSLAIIPTAPSGLLIVTNLNSSSSILARDLNDHINEFDCLNFNDFKEVEKEMKFIGNNFRAIKQHLERYAGPIKRNKKAVL